MMCLCDITRPQKCLLCILTSEHMLALKYTKALTNLNKWRQILSIIWKTWSQANEGKIISNGPLPIYNNGIYTFIGLSPLLAGTVRQPSNDSISTPVSPHRTNDWVNPNYESRVHSIYLVTISKGCAVFACLCF